MTAHICMNSVLIIFNCLRSMAEPILQLLDFYILRTQQFISETADE
jgi:hypothetical protein